MRTRAGIILVEDNKVALIERHRAGLEYYVFPGGGVEEGETPERAAIREAKEELGVEVAIKQKVAVVHFGLSTQIYYLVEQVGGEFGMGTGEEFVGADPMSTLKGTYTSVWMTIDELQGHEKVYPADLAGLVLKAQTDGWAKEAIVIVEQPK